jgi:hypothetical protein
VTMSGTARFVVAKKRLCRWDLTPNYRRNGFKISAGG